METTFFTIDCKTNLHVGSGKANYGVIDQLVQRDPTSQSPVIHASSLKGGIKEYCHTFGFKQMREVFGSEKKADGKTDHDNSRIGTHKFFDAHVLCIPVRSDKRAYIHITCPRIIKHVAESLPVNSALVVPLNALAGIFSTNDNNKAYCFDQGLRDAVIEDFDIKATFDNSKVGLITSDISNFFKHDVVITKDLVFDSLTNDLHLPVIARNYLENGESKNLWYEQAVPRMTRFWSQCIHPEGDSFLKNNIFKSDTLVQIGANGSIGYGFCSFDKI
jgi:CRISPR-associated protein Cmr4